jgi:hypothetical protein
MEVKKRSSITYVQGKYQHAIKHVCIVRHGIELYITIPVRAEIFLNYFCGSRLTYTDFIRTMRRLLSGHEEGDIGT